MLLAELPAAVQNLTHIFVGILAVAGAFIVGGQFTKWFVKFLYASTSRKRLSRPMQTMSRVFGGIGFALLVAYLVFGGLGTGGGRGDEAGDGYAGGKAEKKSDESLANILPKQPKEFDPTLTKKDEGPIAEVRERITVLSGYDDRERYYRVDRSLTPISFPELQSLLRRRMADPDRPLKGITILVYQNSAARNHQLVTKLERWARDQRLNVDFPAVQDERIPE